MYTFSILPSNTPNVSLPVRILHGWSDQSWTKLYFSIYRSSPLIEIYGSPGKYWLVRESGCWLPIYSMKAPFFATTTSRQWQNEWQILRGYSAASRSNREPDRRETLPGFSKRVKSSEYGTNPLESRILPNNCRTVLAVWASTESAERHIFHYDKRPLELGDHKLFQKLLVDVVIELFTGGKQPRWPKLLISNP
jgi:hypothetical protein